MLSQILFSQCDSLQYDKFEYYYFPEIDVDEGHINSSQDCYHKVDWDILQELILVNNLQYEVFNFGSQTWNLNGRLEILLINYSPADSPQFINQKINSLPENFGELKMLNYLEMQKHNLIVLPPSFIKLQNLQTLLLKLNRLKVLNPDFGSRGPQCASEPKLECILTRVGAFESGVPVRILSPDFESGF